MQPREPVIRPDAPWHYGPYTLTPVGDNANLDSWQVGSNRPEGAVIYEAARPGECFANIDLETFRRTPPAIMQMLDFWLAEGSRLLGHGGRDCRCGQWWRRPCPTAADYDDALWRWRLAGGDTLPAPSELAQALEAL